MVRTTRLRRHRAQALRARAARRCATASGAARERAERLHAQSRDVAHTLQQSLLGGGAAGRPALHASRRSTSPRSSTSRSAATGTTPSSLAGDRLGIVVGDVVGRGLQAATAMGQLRSAVRALAGAGFGPRPSSRHLDTFVEQVEAAQYATLAYAEVDPDERRGHARRRRPPAAGAAPAASRSSSSAGARRRSASASPRLPRTQATFTLAPGRGLRALHRRARRAARRSRSTTASTRLLAAIRARPDVAAAGPRRRAARGRQRATTTSAC